MVLRERVQIVPMVLVSPKYVLDDHIQSIIYRLCVMGEQRALRDDLYIWLVVACGWSFMV